MIKKMPGIHICKSKLKLLCLTLKDFDLLTYISQFPFFARNLDSRFYR